jgi:DNA modification methylase
MQLMTEKLNNLELNKIICGDALLSLKSLPSQSVNCIVTSPPYYCLRDYGVAGQIGLENAPEKYIENLTKIFAECYRVLKNDGTLWVVIGDSYAGSGRGWSGKNDLYSRKIQPKASFATEFSKPQKPKGYKSKDLIGIPWQLAFSLRENGWYLRQDIIWHKPNPMPESVTDRCTKAHEYIFLFSKSAKYYFNHAAMLEPANYDNRNKLARPPSKKYQKDSTGLAFQGLQKGGYRWQSVGGQFVRNRRDVWNVPTRAFKGAHFATFPPDLIKPCISAGCPENGVVLDCFMGAGTTALVARELGRNFVGIELNEEYVRLAEERLRKK